MATPRQPVGGPRFDLVVAANRLPVESVDDGFWRVALVPQSRQVGDRHGTGHMGPQRSVVGLGRGSRPSPKPFYQSSLHLRPVSLSAEEIKQFYEGLGNETLWPIYHGLFVQASFHRSWWNTYRHLHVRFGSAIVDVAALGATFWAHDGQFQLVPAMVRALGSDVRIGWFDPIAFPPVELPAENPSCTVKCAAVRWVPRTRRSEAEAMTSDASQRPDRDSTPHPPPQPAAHTPPGNPSPDRGDGRSPPGPGGVTPHGDPGAQAPVAPAPTRAAAAWFATAVALVLLVLLLILILQNQNVVQVHYLGFAGSVSLGTALLVAAVAGAAVVTIVGVIRLTQLRFGSGRRRHSKAERDNGNPRST